jgi:hypothetical protein
MQPHPHCPYQGSWSGAPDCFTAPRSGGGYQGGGGGGYGGGGGPSGGGPGRGRRDEYASKPRGPGRPGGRNDPDRDKRFKDDDEY